MKTLDILHRALAACDRLMADERVLHAQITGSVRRGALEVADLDLLIVTNDPWSFPVGSLDRPPHPDREAHLFIATPETYGVVLAFSTGPQELNRVLRDKARQKGYLFDFATEGQEAKYGSLVGFYGLDGSPTPPIPTPTEEQFFRLVGVPHVPPPFREWLAQESAVRSLKAAGRGRRR